MHRSLQAVADMLHAPDFNGNAFFSPGQGRYIVWQLMAENLPLFLQFQGLYAEIHFQLLTHIGFQHLFNRPFQIDVRIQPPRHPFRHCQRFGKKEHPLRHAHPIPLGHLKHTRHNAAQTAAAMTGIQGHKKQFRRILIIVLPRNVSHWFSHGNGNIHQAFYIQITDSQEVFKKQPLHPAFHAPNQAEIKINDIAQQVKTQISRMRVRMKKAIYKHLS